VNKGKKGVVKHSIFRSPETVVGRVGVGTCGVSGKGMTDYKGAKKYQRNV
jgi:survival-of-motor-neuron-related-splicing factor 30